VADQLPAHEEVRAGAGRGVSGGAAVCVAAHDVAEIGVTAKCGDDDYDGRRISVGKLSTISCRFYANITLFAEDERLCV